MNSRSLDDLYTQNDLCLIIDKKALRSLEELPKNVPELGRDETA